MSQTTMNARYEKLLGERILVGRLYVDHISHGAPFEDAERLFTRVAELEEQLQCYARYSFDEYCKVSMVEDDRWHMPGDPPAVGPDCGLCAKLELHVVRDLVLPAGAPAGRRTIVGEAA